MTTLITQKHIQQVQQLRHLKVSTRFYKLSLTIFAEEQRYQSFYCQLVVPKIWLMTRPSKEKPAPFQIKAGSHNKETHRQKLNPHGKARVRF
jgi:hypothetical protein